MSADEKRHARVREIVDGASTPNADLALRADQEFSVLPRDFTADEDEITPTLKLKRRVCEQHFAAEIERLFGGD